jgi:hypothetical protein
MGTKSKWLKGKLTFWNNAVVNEDVYSTGVVGATTIRNWGMVVLSPAAAASYHIKGGPAIGQTLDIVIDTTEIATVLFSNTKNEVTIGGTSFNSLVFVPGSTNHPQSVRLRGQTTSRWQATSMSTQKGGFVLSSATGA